MNWGFIELGKHMPPAYTLKDVLVENRLFLNRIVLILIAIGVVSLGLMARLIYLQVVGHAHYASLSQDNRVKIAPLPPTRGLILDRNGEVLAQNIPTYSLELISEQVPDLDQTLKALRRLLTISEEEIGQFKALVARRKPFESIPLKLRLSDEEVARFAVKRPHFPGVDIHARLIRNYPYGEFSSHVIGYMGRIDEHELRTLDPALYRGTHYIGKTGIEKTYEHLLHGQTGYEEIETNAKGRSIHVLGGLPPAPGADLNLTLDIDLQKTAYAALGDYNGAVVALEPSTGKVLAMVSKPAFDPNRFVHGIKRETYRRLQSSQDQPLFNRALRGQYPPGSTIKPFLGLAGLEYAVTSPYQKTYCPGYYRLPNVSHRYRDWKKHGHGLTDLKKAITQSCDVYFYDLSLNLGIDRIHDFLEQFGFGELTGIDIVGEKKGLLPSQQWKRLSLHQPWYPGETLITGIGQGFTQVTPLQLAKATAIIANRGRRVHPHVIDAIQTVPEMQPVESEPIHFVQAEQKNWDTIIQAMVDVVHSPRGTARRIGQAIPYQIAGKTGTAQVFSVKQEEEYDENAVAKKLRDHALFIAFAPADRPRIAVAVVAENAGHGGSVAAPIAQQVIEHHLKSAL